MIQGLSLLSWSSAGEDDENLAPAFDRCNRLFCCCTQLNFNACFDNSPKCQNHLEFLSFSSSGPGFIKFSLLRPVANISKKAASLNLKQVRKCCPVGERLDSSDPTSPRCVQHSSSSQEMNIVGLDLTKDPGSRKVNLTLALDSRHPGMPKCKPEGAKVFSVLTEKAWLTAKGNLVQDSQVCRFNRTGDVICTTIQSCFSK